MRSTTAPLLALAAHLAGCAAPAMPGTRPAEQDEPTPLPPAADARRGPAPDGAPAAAAGPAPDGAGAQAGPAESTPPPSDGPAPSRSDVGADRTAAPSPRDAAANAIDVGGPAVSCRFKLCESFEAVAEGALPGAPWRRDFNNGARGAVESGRAARGTRALHIRMPTTWARGYLAQSSTFPITGNAYYGRAFLFVEKGSQSTAFMHWAFVETRSRDSSLALEYGGSYRGPGTMQLGLNLNSGSGETGLGDRGPIPERTWHCLEWYFDGPRNEARLWWNGQERTRLHYQMNSSDPRYGFPTFHSVHVGFEQHQTLPAGDTGFDVWIDEIAIDGQRIGCDG